MKIYLATFFGCSVIISGLIRYVGGPDGEKGLWFGVVCGTIALAASLCIAKERYGLGQALLWTSLLFVGGWFGYEAFIKKGFADAELRLLIMFVLTVVTAALQWLPGNRTDPEH